MFADVAFRDAVGLSAMNSINWARVMAQVVYYVTAAQAVGAGEPGVVLGAHRQLRQRVRRLGGPPHRHAHQPARRRLQQQRHPHPLARHRA